MDAESSAFAFDDLLNHPFFACFSCNCGEFISTASPFSLTCPSECVLDEGAMAGDVDLQRVNLMVAVDNQGEGKEIIRKERDECAMGR